MYKCKTRSPAIARVSQLYSLYPKATSNFLFQEKKAIFYSDYSHYARVTVLYQMLQSVLGYDTVMRRTWVIGCKQQLCIQNCGQSVPDRDMVSTHNDSLKELVVVPSPTFTMHRLATMH